MIYRRITYRWGVTLDEYNTLAKALDESPLLQHALLYRARYPGDRNWLVATVTDRQRRALYTAWPFLVQSCVPCGGAAVSRTPRS